MGLLDNFRVNQAIGTVLTSVGGGAAVAAASAQIRDLGPAAVPRLVQNLGRDQHGTLSELLREVITTSTLPVVIKDGLLSHDPIVAAGARRALAGAEQIDANRLFELYISNGGSISEIGDLLVSRRAALSGKSMLRLLELAKSDPDASVFKLIDQLATDAMVGPLIGFLKHADWSGRVQIARILARFPSEQVRDALVHLLSDQHRLVREAALDGLPAMKLPVPPAPVVALLRDPDLMVQGRAIECAVKLNDSRCIPLLLEVLQDESEHARRAAVEVLNAVGDANAIKDLMIALKDQDWWVRVRAADALGAIGGPKVIDAVLQLLGSEDEFMRRTAMEILNTTKDKRAFDYLVTALNDPDWWVRERAVDALANIGDKRAVPYLMAMLAGEDEATPVVIRALAQLADPRAIEALLGKLASRDASIQREAITAIGVLAQPEHLAAVMQQLQALAPASAEIRQAALTTMSELSARVKRTGPAPARTASPAAPAGAKAGLMETVVVSDRSQKSAGARSRSVEVDEPLQQTATMHVSHGDEPTEDLSQRKEPRLRPAGGARLDLSSVAPGLQLAGRYTVAAELGRGGFGIVLRVTDGIIGEDIALKLINPQLIQDEETITRFLHEVRYSRKVTHENVIRVHDFLELDGLYGISMEHFASNPLSRQIRRGLHQRPARGMRYVRDIARGIRAAHQASVMHRDLKPANILVNDLDVLKIVDFGLAAACSHASSRVTRTGTLIGTPSYMSPEQGRGVDLDYRTDIYSLGVIMYEVFTGTVPYAADNALAVLYLHLQGKKDPPSARNPMITPELEAVILKAMAVDPADRYQSADEMLAALEALSLPETA
jgi:serine/threonine-protein kinase